MLIDLVENATLLISLCWLHGMITRYLDENTLPGKLAAGSLFGIVCVAGMLMPLTLAEGLIFDGRTVVLSMASFFGGPLVGFLAGGIAGLFRWSIGGVGILPGLLNVLMPVLMGLIFRALHRRDRVPFSSLAILIFALSVQLLQVLNLTLLPADQFALFRQHALLPMLVVLIPATWLLVLLLQDIHEQKRARKALRVSEAYLQAIIESVPDVSMVLDEDGRYLKIRSPDESLLYASATELLGKYLTDVLPASQAEMFLQFIRRSLVSDSPQSIEYSLHTLGGLRTFEARARRLDTPVAGRRAVLLMARDITERVALEMDQRIAAIALLITDARARIIKVNQAFSKITGYSEAEVIGQPTRMLGSGRQAPGAGVLSGYVAFTGGKRQLGGRNLEPPQKR